VKGRKCSGEEAPYSKPAVQQLREKYREALSELEFLTEQNSNLKRLEEMEQKLDEKDQVIEALAKNGAELKAKVAKIEFQRKHRAAFAEGS
jgi:predicted nuclease with TOPRIM domain